jgi:hypothetical protein
MHTEFISKPEGKSQLGRSRGRWESNIQIGLKKKERLMTYIGYIRLRIGSSGGLCQSDKESSGSKKMRNQSDYTLSRRTLSHVLSVVSVTEELDHF